jgi:hypothetical protein
MTHPVEGGLGRLIETETRLAQGVAAAEQEAASLVSAARAAAEASAAGSQATLDAQVAELTRQVAAGRDAEIADVLRAADERCRRLRELPAETIDQLAEWVEHRVLAPRDEGGPA